MRHKAGAASEVGDRLAQRVIELDDVDDRPLDDRDEHDASRRAMTAVAVASLAGGEVAGALAGHGGELGAAAIGRHGRGRFDGDPEDVLLVVELGPHAAAGPTAGDPLEERLLLGLERAALPEHDDRPAKSPRLVELVLRWLRVARADN